MREPEALLQALAEEARTRRELNLERHRRLITTACGAHVQLAQADGQPGAVQINFLANDYLGLANHPTLVDALAAGVRQWGAGSAASPLVSGHLACHAAAEQALSAFVGAEAALLFITGYLANLAILPALADSAEDVILSDALNHASLIDACRLARGQVVRYAHADVEAVEQHLVAHRAARRRLIVTDGVFSMDGDVAPVQALLQLAEQHDALLVVDDAHGLGVLGQAGRGTLAGYPTLPPRVVLMGTLGKAFGLSGAFVAASAPLVQHLVQRARPYIFSTSPAPAVAAAIPHAVQLVAGADDRRARLHDHRQTLAARTQGWRYRPQVGSTPIVPVIVGEAARAMAWAARLAEAGVLVAGIRPPTVPVGSSRLRISLSAAHGQADIEALLAAARVAGLEGQGPE